MCDQIPPQYPDNEDWIAIPAQPILPSTGTIKPDSDVEARVTLFMQTTGRGLQGQYWRKSAFELSKWLTAQIQYERQGWQLKLQTALKEIESYRREALMADKVLSDSLDLLLQCMDTCAINYSANVSAVSNKKQLLAEYVEVLTGILKFLIQERSQCFCLMQRKPDMKVNLVECIHQYLDAEIESKKEAKSYTEKQEELHSVISDMRNELDSFQKVATYENWIPTNYFQRQPSSFTIRKYKKRRFGSVSPLLMRLDTDDLKNNTLYRLKGSACDREDKNMVNADQKTIQESLKSLNTKEVDRNGKCYIVSHPINVNETIMKYSEDPPPTALAEKRSLKSDDSSASDSRTQYSLPPIKGKQIKDIQRKTGSAKSQPEFIHPPVPPPSTAELPTSQSTTTPPHLQQQQQQQQQRGKIKQGETCFRCKSIYRVKENQKLSCCYHPKGKKRVERLDETGKLIKNVFIWQCCNRSLESAGCTFGLHS